MSARGFWLSFIRFLVLLFSVGTLACHIVQIVLLRTNDWFPSYIPYVLYFVGPGVSIISAAALNVVSITNIKSIRGDRTLCIPNLALMVAVIVYNTLKGGAVPWTKERVAGVPSATVSVFVTYCGNISDSTIANRCWLTDGMWLGCLLIAAFWLILGIFVFVQQGSDIYDDDYDVYDFKDDVPMVVPSPAPAKNTEYHAASPTTAAAAAAEGDYNYYNAATMGGGNQAGYQQYDSYYDYPPRSPYAGYNQATPTSPGGYQGAGGYGGYQGGESMQMMSNNTMDQSQYYSSHLNSSSAHPPANTQTPNAY